MLRFATLLTTLSLAACFSPSYESGAFQCSSEGDCPDGFDCRPDGFCYKEGEAGGELPAEGDQCSEAQLLISGQSTFGSLERSSDDGDYSCGTPGSSEIYYTFTLSTNRSINLSLGSATDTTLALLEGDCATEAACVGASEVGEALSIDDLAAGTYFVVVETNDGVTGDFSLEFTTDDPILRPVNNSCASPTELEDGVPRNDETMVLAQDLQDTSCGDEGLVDVVYQFEIPPGDNQRAIITVDNAEGFDPVIALSGSECGSVDLFCSQARFDTAESLDVPNLEPGTYTVWVEADGQEPGTFDILLDLLPAVPSPGNEDCDTASPLTLEIPAVSSTTGASDDLELSCLASDSRDTVHSFTIAEDSAVLVSVEALTDWRVAASLRDGDSCGDTNDISCVANAVGSRFINQPTLPAGDYDIVIDGANGEHGDYALLVEAAPADDTFGYRAITDLRQFEPLGAGASSFTVTAPDFDDEETFTIAIPFGFSYFGVPQTSVNVHTNGFLSFDPIHTGLHPEHLFNECPMDDSTPLNMIAVFWDDHIGSTENVAGGEQTLKHQIIGEAPNRRLVVEWREWDLFATSTCDAELNGCDQVNTRVSHQAILHENGDIEFHYGPRTNPFTPRDCLDPHKGCSATIGLRNATGDDIDLFGCETENLIDTNAVIRFVHPR